ncbi:hypothetical protein [uncultured Oscillibacter sp.]|uniref:hypothetical protein n=2 Tax=uncultured Oscillibacter sp. TaxID=876091 RepID=UPI00262FB2AE|nr:hypothetical protein [uncultured Oscillibacter sp.]
MKRWPCVFMLLLLAACGQARVPEEPLGKTASLEEETPEDVEAPGEAGSIQSAVLEGELLSPDGRFLARMEGHRESVTSMGLYPADTVQITGAETGEVLWEGDGSYSQSILGSPEGGFSALARSARTWCSITVIETEGWTKWDFTLPDGSPVLEYTFLPDSGPWGVWQSEGSLDLTTGQGGDAGEQRHYTCAVETRDGKLKGIAWEERYETLPGSYDFDHDGEPEIVELVNVAEDEERNLAGWYELRARRPDNRLYWSNSFAEAHVGWGSCFACRVDGEDYLLRYLPSMYQGYATYTYELFFLDETGEEQVVRDGSVSFDINFGAPVHERFNPAAVAAFLEEVHGLLEDSELLLATEGGNFRSGGPGSDFKDDLAHWTDNELYDENKSLEENIRDIGACWEENRTA